MTDKPDLTRIWGEGAPSGNVVDPDTTTPGKFSNGWQAEVPPFEHFNFIQKFQTQGLAHINEQGIAVWDDVTTYPVGGLAKGSDGNVYKALISQNDNDPVSDGGTNWVDWEVTNRVIRATSVADIEAYSAPVGYVFSLNAGGRSGDFDVVAGDFSTELAEDTLNGIYVGLADDPTATTKVAKRRYEAFANFEWFGAVGDGISDDTTIINSALLVIPKIQLRSFYKITDKINFPFGVFILGTDRHSSGFVVKSDFNLSATGVMGPSAVYEPGPELKNFGIYFEQNANETVRANLIQYPPGLDFVTYRAPRTKLSGLRIQGAMNCIDMRTNNGGVILENLELMGLNNGLLFDDPKDFVFLSNIEMWPYGYPGTNLGTVIWGDGNTRFADLKSVDSLVATNMATFQADILITAGFGLISQCSLDGRYASLKVSGGKWGIGTAYSTGDASDDFAIEASDGAHVTIGSMWCDNATNLTGSLGLIRALDANTELLIGNLHATTSGASTRLLYTSEAYLAVNNGYFQFLANTDMLTDPILSVDGTLSLNNIKILDKVSGTGNAINLQNNSRHSITNVIAPGWTFSGPSDVERIVFSGNEFKTKTIGARRIVETKYFEYAGSFDSSGEADINHGLTTPNLKYPQISANIIEADGTRRAITDVLINGTQINIAGGPNNGTYEVVLNLRK